MTNNNIYSDRTLIARKMLTFSSHPQNNKTMNPNIIEKSVNQLIQAEDSEQRFILNGVTWQQYEALLETIGDNFPGLHITYLEGTLQLMSPNRNHEVIKKMIAKLVEAYLEETRTRHYPLGSTTFRKEAKARGVEPDECYCIGLDKEFPDLAIEVVITSGGIDTLEVYKGLEVPEVWFWENQFELYRLRDQEYEKIVKSELLPKLDLQLLASYVNNPEPLDAVQEFRKIIRQQLQKDN